MRIRSFTVETPAAMADAIRDLALRSQSGLQKRREDSWNTGTAATQGRKSLCGLGFVKKTDNHEGAAEFRGGVCLSEEMDTGNWIRKLKFQCAFGHEFEASPRLILEGGHWCPEIKDFTKSSQKY